MDTTPVFNTARLLLTPLQLSDAPAIQQLFPHWEVVRFLDSRVPWPYPDDGALTYVRDIALPAIAAGHEWHWMISLARARAEDRQHLPVRPAGKQPRLLACTEMAGPRLHA